MCKKPWIPCSNRGKTASCDWSRVCESVHRSYFFLLLQIYEFIHNNVILLYSVAAVSNCLVVVCVFFSLSSTFFYLLFIRAKCVLSVALSALALILISFSCFEWCACARAVLFSRCAGQCPFHVRIFFLRLFYSLPILCRARSSSEMCFISRKMRIISIQWCIEIRRCLCSWSNWRGHERTKGMERCTYVHKMRVKLKTWRHDKERMHSWKLVYFFGLFEMQKIQFRFFLQQ